MWCGIVLGFKNIFNSFIALQEIYDTTAAFCVLVLEIYHHQRNKIILNYEVL